MTARLRDQAYDHIFRRLIEGSLLPGMRLSNRGLAKEIGISPIPVREAISQLVSEGLVDDRAREGAFVIQPSATELCHLFELRIAIESYTTSRVARLITPEHLERMTTCNEQMLEVIAEQEAPGGSHRTPELIDRWLEADVGLHLVLFEAAGNPHMSSLISNLWVKTHVLVHQSRKASWKFTRATCDDHIELIEALRVGDGGEARNVMEKHIARAYKYVLSYLTPQHGEAAAGERTNSGLFSRLKDSRPR